MRIKVVYTTLHYPTETVREGICIFIQKVFCRYFLCSTISEI